MFKNLSILLCFVFILSCNCQTTAKKDNQDIASDKISMLLGEKNYAILKGANTTIQFDIQKKLIEGTDSEFSNKVIFKDTLNPKRIRELINILINDENYDWNRSTEGISFDPTHQLLFKSESGRLSLLLDKKERAIGFINLDGQKLVALTDELTDFLINL